AGMRCDPPKRKHHPQGSPKRSSMIVMIKTPESERKPGRGRHGAMIVAIAALAVAAVAWFWLTRQPPQPQAGYGAPHGVIVIGIGAFIAALIAQVRSMSVVEMLEAL